MINKDAITAWSIDHPWPDTSQIEQDLLLSMAICEISNDDLLKNELVLRGGTAFHKLFMPTPFRYSEDLDYIRTSSGGIGDVMKELTSLGKRIGFDVSTKIGMYPKVYWRYTSENGIPSRIKIEINTYEREPKFNFINIVHQVDSIYYTGHSSIKTLEIEELIASKIRALYQRSKGRDLYDIYLALDYLHVNTDKIIEAFTVYKPENITKELLLSNFRTKMEDYQFLNDMNNLLRSDAPHYDAYCAGKKVEKDLLDKLL